MRNRILTVYLRAHSLDPLELATLIGHRGALTGQVSHDIIVFGHVGESIQEGGKGKLNFELMRIVRDSIQRRKLEFRLSG